MVLRSRAEGFRKDVEVAGCDHSSVDLHCLQIVVKHEEAPLLVLRTAELDASALECVGGEITKLCPLGATPGLAQQAPAPALLLGDVLELCSELVEKRAPRQTELVEARPVLRLEEPMLVFPHKAIEQAPQRAIRPGTCKA